jgi:hypothetical protein
VPRVGSEDRFEQQYLSQLKAILAPHGQLVRYESDRAALDLGLHLYDAPAEEGDARLSQVRVWFQAKGIRSSTLDDHSLADADRLPVEGLRIEHIKSWFAHPEPVYLVVYLEAVDRFVAEDVRDLVDREGGLPWLARIGATQRTTTLHPALSASLDQALERMPRHRTLRLDGPEFRGRPLGHRLDPLRSELDQLSPSDFNALVWRLLSAHDFRPSREIDVATSLGKDLGDVTLSVGKLYLTYEWTTPIATEFGVDPGSDFRIEAKPESAHGDVLVCVHSNVAAAPPRTDHSKRLVDVLQQEGVERALVFLNASEANAGLFGSWRLALEPLVGMPQGLGSLAFNVLTATNVYLEFLDRLTWRHVNYR